MLLAKERAQEAEAKAAAKGWRRDSIGFAALLRNAYRTGGLTA